MKIPFSYKQLGEKVKSAYIYQEDYQMERHLKEFLVDGKYVGDYLNYTIFENLPAVLRFYLIGGPYDIISHKAPQQALIFENGQLVLNVDYTHYADVRTGLMDALIVNSLGHSSMENKQILYLGTGKVARESLSAMKEYFPDLSTVSYINSSGQPKEFGELARSLNITLESTSLDDLEKYDYIFAHTTAIEPVLTKEYLTKIKQGAVITTFTGPGTEVGDEFFNDSVSVLTDWENSFTASKDLQRPLENKSLTKEKVVLLRDFFSGKTEINEESRYTIYRSTGTPMQNLAVLQLLLESH